jgi:hypothetical protein
MTILESFFGRELIKEGPSENGNGGNGRIVRKS